ncbi:hypothetical protein BCR39DRAFT_548127 [Naematelia encephala]|uniref:Uncharacterized protein n=1 Tax=Naematelia encephala TaxID=71784 RepID=A0A1Y2APZ5_9TREE|nr:hypothetical protein BCR39DRAFT_548127 [Naematelia encephala]
MSSMLSLVPDPIRTFRSLGSGLSSLRSLSSLFGWPFTKSLGTSTGATDETFESSTVKGSTVNTRQSSVPSWSDVQSTVFPELTTLPGSFPLSPSEKSSDPSGPVTEDLRTTGASGFGRSTDNNDLTNNGSTIIDHPSTDLQPKASLDQDRTNGYSACSSPLSPQLKLEISRVH